MPTMSERTPSSADQAPNWDEEIKDGDQTPDEGEDQRLNAQDFNEGEGDEGEGEGGTDYEAEAREMGWRPKSEYSGREEMFLDPKEYVRRGKEVMPILNAREREAREENAKLRKQLEEVTEAAKGHTAFIDNQRKAQRNFEAAQLKQRRLEALENQDWAAVNEIDIELMAKREAPETPSFPANAPKGPTPTPPDPAIAELWENNVKAHPWLSDKSAQEDWGAEAVALRLAGNKDVGTAFVERVNARMRRLYPDKFAGRRQSMVEGGGSPSNGFSRGGSRTFDDLSQAYRNEFFKNAKKLGITKAEFLKECGPECFGG